MHMMHTDEAVEFNVGNNKRPPPFLGELTRGLLQRFRSISRVSYVCLFLSRLSTLYACTSTRRSRGPLFLSDPVRCQPVQVTPLTNKKYSINKNTTSHHTTLPHEK